MIPALLATLVIIAGDGKISTAPVPDAQCADLASYAMFEQSVAEHAKAEAAKLVFEEEQRNRCVEHPAVGGSLWICGGTQSISGAGIDPSRQFTGPDGYPRRLYEPKTAGCLP